MSAEAEHKCPFAWCTTNWSESREHWCLEYATVSGHRGDPKVGVGVVYEEGDLPVVVVHLDGGQRDVDVNTHMRIGEAITLRELLDEAISAAKLASRHMADQMIAEHGLADA